MKILPSLLNYLKFFLLTALAVIVLLFVLPLIPSLVAGIQGHSPIDAYLISGFSILGLMLKSYYFFLISPVVLIWLSHQYPDKKINSFLLSALVPLVFFSAVWASVFVYSFGQQLFSDSWKARIQWTQYADKGEQAALSNQICDDISGQIEVAGKSLEDVLNQIDSKSKAAGFAIATDHVYIQRGYITYYFKPSTSESLEFLKEKASSVFQKSFIGPTFYWLNSDWYNQYLKGSPYPTNNQLIDIHGDLISIRYETLFPVLGEFITKKILQVPPPHILKAAEVSGLDFVRSERRDYWGYTYSVPIPFYELTGENYNVNYAISAVRTSEGYFDPRLENLSCLWPHNSLKISRNGSFPSKNNDSPRMPQEIPSCGEYRKWLNCQKGANKPSCSRPQFKKGATAPVCEPLTVSFPEETYGPKRSGSLSSSP